MDYRFRIRVDLATTCFFDVPGEELRFSPPGSAVLVRLVAADGQEAMPLSAARSVVLVGGEFGSEQEAIDQGNIWLSRFRRFLIATRTGVDFGERAATGAFTDLGLAALEAEHGGRTLNDVHGLSVYASDPQPRFARSSATARRSAGPDALVEAVKVAWDGPPGPLPDRVRIAYDLAAASMSTADEARLLLLMMALETLLVIPQRAEPTLSFVESLIDQVRMSPLGNDDKQSLLGAMQWLRLESIGRSGKNYVARLEPKTYDGRAPKAFFNRCYEMRSQLVHGALPRPARELVDPLASNLEVMVNDLLRTEVGLKPES